MTRQLCVAVLILAVASPAAAASRTPSPTDAKLANTATATFAGNPAQARAQILDALAAYRAESDPIGIGVSYLLLGMTDVAAENRATAREELAEASRRLVAAGDGFAAWLALWTSADLERSTGNFVLAIEQHEVALDFLRDTARPDEPFPVDGAVLLVMAFGMDPEPVKLLAGMKPILLKMCDAMTRDGYGATLTEAGYLQEAEHQLTLAASASRELMGFYDSTIHGHFGDLYRRLWCLEDARTSYRKALTGVASMPLIPLRDEWLQVGIFGQLAEIELLRGRIDEALRWNDRALAAVRPANPKQEAAILTARAELLLRAGRCAAAVEPLMAALKIAGEQNDVHRQAAALMFLGSAHVVCGRYGDAARSLEKSVELFQRVQRPDQEALAWTSLSEVYVLLGAKESARVTVERARKTATTSSVPLAQTLIEIVAASIADRDYAKYFGAWWELPESGGMMFRPEVRGLFRHLLGLSGPDEAAPDVAEVESTPLLAAMAHLVRGKLLFQRGRIAEARDEWTKGLARKPGDDLRATLLAAIGASYWKQGNSAEAIRHFRQAARVTELPIADLRVEELMAGYLGSQRRWFYEILIELLVREGKLPEAFDYAERARARAFQQMIGTTRLRPDGAAAPLVEEAETLRAEIRRLEQQALNGPPGELREAKRRYEGLLARIKVTSPEYAHAAVIEPLGLEALRRHLPPDTTLISYFVSSQGAHAWLFDGVMLQYGPVAVPPARLRRIVCWASNLGRYELPAASRGATRLRPYCGRRESATSEEVYDALIEPLRSRIRNKRLLIVPHGDLHYVPFAALRNRQTKRYLIQDYTISYLPSAGSLLFLNSREDETTGRALVIGNPANPSSATRPIPGTQTEAEYVASAFGTTPLLGADATENVLRGIAGRFDLVHIGTHGLYDAVTPMFSRIELAKDPNDPESDGNLEVHEILSEVDLTGVNLVVLSACRSAAGVRTGGDDIVGLTRAILYAGSPAVISTLWDIKDNASAELMQRFYTALRAGDLPADALRKAQEALIKDGQYADPYFWAAFVLNGDSRERWK